MGNYRFKFSDMIPNAWFYKLRDLGKHPTRNLKNTTHSTKKKLHYTKSLSNPNPVNSPAITSPSSSSHHLSSNPHQRKSYHITRDVNQTPSPNHEASFYPGAESTHTVRNRRPDNLYDINDPHGVLQPPRRSSKKRRCTRRSRASPRLVTSSMRADCSCQTTVESVWANLPDSTSQKYPVSAADTNSSENESFSPLKGSSFAGAEIDGGMVSSCSWSCRLDDDIVVDVDSGRRASQFVERIVGVDAVSTIELPPIKTSYKNSSETKDCVKQIESTNIRRQSAKCEERHGYKSVSLSVKMAKDDMVSKFCQSPREEEKSSTKAKRYSVSSNSPGLKLKTNSPRIVSRRIKGRKSLSSGNWRRGLSESLAVVKSSKDPQRDFKESMVEMIVENKMWSSKEMEDLLACYLSLNSEEYHHIIIRVFKQIWFDVVHSPLTGSNLFTSNYRPRR